MKAKVIATGEIVDVIHIGHSKDLHEAIFCDKNRYEYFGRELEFIDKNNTYTTPKKIDWEQRRFELANAAMHGILSGKYIDTIDYVLPYVDGDPNTYQLVGIEAIKFADAVIEKLKED